MLQKTVELIKTSGLFIEVSLRKENPPPLPKKKWKKNFLTTRRFTIKCQEKASTNTTIYSPIFPKKKKNIHLFISTNKQLPKEKKKKKAEDKNKKPNPNGFRNNNRRKKWRRKKKTKNQLIITNCKYNYFKIKKKQQKASTN